MKTYYSVEIRRLGFGWGTLPMGALRKAWMRHCGYRNFKTIEEALNAMVDMWYDIEADDIRAKMAEDITDEEAERLLDKAYQDAKWDIGSKNMYRYDDGECTIVKEEY